VFGKILGTVRLTLKRRSGRKQGKRSTQRSQRKVIQKQEILCGLCVEAFRLLIFRAVLFNRNYIQSNVE
jgi:hypothetical protein